LVTSVESFRGEIIVGGSFDSVGGVPVNNLARWDGSTWHPLGSGIEGVVWDLQVYNDDLIVGGEFTGAGGLPVQGIARWDGSNWFSMEGGTAGDVDCMIVHDGDLYVGGGFSYVGGVYTRGGLARWDGTTWYRLLGDERLYGYGIAFLGDDLMAAGRVHENDGEWRDVVFQWEGSTWTRIADMPPGYSETYQCLTVYDGSLYLGGRFDEVNGVRTGGIARYDGSAWSSLGSGLPILQQLDLVKDMFVWQGHLMVGGLFGAAGNKASRMIARWDSRLPVPHSDPVPPRRTIDPRLVVLPMNHGARITFTLVKDSDISVDIYDVSGRRVRDVVHAAARRGDQTVSWDGRDHSGRRVASGVYFIALRAGSQESSSRFVLR
jgi:hypothetical protein